jgi:hypothetical protein
LSDWSKHKGQDRSSANAIGGSGQHVLGFQSARNTKVEGTASCIARGKKNLPTFARALKAKLDAQNFDFGGVWFPDDLDLRTLELKTAVNFRRAAFSGKASFDQATFAAEADFGWARFGRGAGFAEAIFSGDARSSRPRSGAGAHFGHTGFSGGANFDGAECSKRGDFLNATLTGI